MGESCHAQRMRLLLSSAVRAAQIGPAKNPFVAGAELWVRNTDDYQTAASLFAEVTGHQQQVEWWRRN